MIFKTELYTFPVATLLELLGAQQGGGRLTLLTNDDEEAEFDLDDVCCMCIRVETPTNDDSGFYPIGDDDSETLPFSRN